jgi:hypothetical protein
VRDELYHCDGVCDDLRQYNTYKLMTALTSPIILFVPSPQILHSSRPKERVGLFVDGVAGTGTGVGAMEV